MGEIKNKNKLGEFTRFLEEELFLQLKEAKIDEFEFAAESIEVEKNDINAFSRIQNY